MGARGAPLEDFSQERPHHEREGEREGWIFALCLVDFGWERERGERKGEGKRSQLVVS